MPSSLKLFGRFLVYIFAAVGLFLSAGWAAVNLHLTDESGRVDPNDRYLARLARGQRGQEAAGDLLCRAAVLNKYYPENGGKIMTAYERTRSAQVLMRMLGAAELYASTNPAYARELDKCSDAGQAGNILLSSGGRANLYGWINTEEWQTMKEALAKDKEVIALVAEKTGVPARLIAAQIVGEQLRLFHDNREIFKQFFQPLKILGNEVQFSLGVAGIKEATAKQIEHNLTDRSSVYYPGKEYEHLLDFSTREHEQERFARLTDPHDRYYPYLYTALFLKQIEKQWKDAGYDISDRPEILATIFNVGFANSKPNPDPKVGGSDIQIAGKTYTFGALAYEFYFSGELLDEFPL